MFWVLGSRVQVQGSRVLWSGSAARVVQTPQCPGPADSTARCGRALPLVTFYMRVTPPSSCSRLQMGRDRCEAPSAKIHTQCMGVASSFTTRGPLA